MTPPATRREARAAHLLATAPVPVRHARARRAARIRVGFAAVAAAALGIGGAAAITAAVIAPELSASAGLVAEATPTASPVPLPQAVSELPAPKVEAAAAIADLCADPAFVAALESGDDEATLAAAGGAEPFRAAVASGTAECVSLADPARLWVVVNKARASDPIDYRPGGLAAPAGVRDIAGGSLRGEAAGALADMIAAARAAGAGEIALESGFRSYATQQSTYGRQVSSRGAAGADLVSARPGYSEHQTGLAADVTACTYGCDDMGTFGGTAQQEWVAAHSWEFGWIVRYVEGRTEITGYSPEPWHLRYIGPELASVYHEGGWQSLEEFFGLPAAPDYGD
ncbi:M15 family metallopeptidase [Microbacterium sp. NPDC019599]|uniref:M15 family metallopeptidase n=1 Tax=Microbacterium sp. NPDC019599 TaxID=3154690 RepID=UPI0033D69107